MITRRFPCVIAGLASIPAAANAEAFVVWPMAFMVICLAIVVIIVGLQESIKVKVVLSAVIVILAFLSINGVIKCSPFANDNYNAFLSKALVPIGSALVLYISLKIFRKWLAFAKSKQ